MTLTNKEREPYSKRLLHREAAGTPAKYSGQQKKRKSSPLVCQSQSALQSEGYHSFHILSVPGSLGHNPNPFLNGVDIIIHVNEVLFSVSDEMSGSMGGQPREHPHTLQKADEQQEGKGWQGLSFQTPVKKRRTSNHAALVTLRETTLRVEDRKW